MLLHHRSGRLAVLGWLALSLLPSACVSTTRHGMRGLDALSPEVDPLACTSIELSGDTGIRREIIRERCVLPNQELHVLEYSEVAGLDIERLDADRAYANIFLVAKTQLGCQGEQSVVQRYLVTDLWRFYPERRIKVCLQWTIWEDALGAPPQRASLQVFVQDYGSRVIEEYEGTIGPEQLAALARYYRRMQAAFEQRLRTATGRGGNTATP